MPLSVVMELHHLPLVSACEFVLEVGGIDQIFRASCVSTYTPLGRELWGGTIMNTINIIISCLRYRGGLHYHIMP